MSGGVKTELNHLISRVTADGEFLRASGPLISTDEARALIDPGVRIRRDLHTATVRAFLSIRFCVW